MNELARSDERLLQQVEQQIVDDLAPVECPVRHLFANGVYAREMFIPAGTLITSRVHRDEHLCCLSAGSIAVKTVGGGVGLLRAPHSYVSAPGARRVGLAVEDVVWTTYHSVGELRDVDAIEVLIFEPMTVRQEELVARQRRVIESGGTPCLVRS